jgi:hypothetical protein
MDSAQSEFSCSTIMLGKKCVQYQMLYSPEKK